MEEKIQQYKLDLKTKFYYGFGSIAFGIKNNGFSYFVLFVYSSVLGLPAWMAGLALNLVLIADAITDPLVGYLILAEKQYKNKLTQINHSWNFGPNQNNFKKVKDVIRYILKIHKFKFRVIKNNKYKETNVLKLNSSKAKKY